MHIIIASDDSLVGQSEIFAGHCVDDPIKTVVCEAEVRPDILNHEPHNGIVSDYDHSSADHNWQPRNKINRHHNSDHLGRFEFALLLLRSRFSSFVFYHGAHRHFFAHDLGTLLCGDLENATIREDEADEHSHVDGEWREKQHICRVWR